MNVFKYAINGSSDNITFLNTLPQEFTMVSDDGEETAVIKTGGFNAPEVRGNFIAAPNLILQVGDFHYQHTAMGVVTKGLYNHQATFCRWTKSVGNYVLNNIFKELNGYLPILPYTSIDHLPENEAGWVIRPEMAARGLGIVKVPPHRTPESIWCKILKGEQDADIKMLLDRPTSTSVDANDVSDPNAESKQHYAHGYSVVPFIPDIYVEYRLLTGADGKFSIACKRVRREVGVTLPMATGSDADPRNTIYFSHFMEEARANGIASDLDARVLMQLADVRDLPPLCSFDLFITKDGRWGFFEFSPEFGRTGIPSDWIHKETMAMFKNIYKQVVSPSAVACPVSQIELRPIG